MDRQPTQNRDVRTSKKCERIERVTVDLEAVLTWVRLTRGRPIAGDLVPGASEDERRMLSVLGGLVSGIVADHARTGWPDDVLRWLANGPSAPAEIVE